LKPSEPFDACEQLVEDTSPPINKTISTVLVTESGCELHTKIINAFEAGFKCIVIMSSNSDEARVTNSLLKGLLHTHIPNQKETEVID